MTDETNLQILRINNCLSSSLISDVENQEAPASSNIKHKVLPSFSSRGSYSSLPSSPPLVFPSSFSSSSYSLNWQSEKRSTLERNAVMYNNPLMSDVSFLVGESSEVIHAHKFILATGSSVFYAMLYGDLKDRNEDVIKIPDVEHSAFLTMLKYLYVDLVSCNHENVLSTLYCAKKYILPHLAKTCVGFLESSLSAKNAAVLLSQSRLFDEPELMSRCWEVIDAQAELALTAESFVEIDYETLTSILSRKTLNSKESIVFHAAIRWAKNQISESHFSFSKIREILGSAIYLIRFPAMSIQDFADDVASSDILSLKEINDIFLHFTATKFKPVLNYNSEPRVGLPIQSCKRFMSSAYRSNQWRYRGRCDSIQFSVDTRVFIVGYGLYGSSNGSSDYTAKIELKNSENLSLAESLVSFTSDGSSNTFRVFFDQPVQIEPESFYTASVVLSGKELSYFGQEGLSEIKVGGVNFNFQCSSESTNGTGVQGGQIPELLLYEPSSST